MLYHVVTSRQLSKDKLRGPPLPGRRSSMFLSCILPPSEMDIANGEVDPGAPHGRRLPPVAPDRSHFRSLIWEWLRFYDRTRRWTEFGADGGRLSQREHQLMEELAGMVQGVGAEM
ncbi:unnamed protein product [Amoebophrya sp. A120]|nr:unnamed protein product [Amoebophrya sp. A120]|eukprot:GSA120T00014553001.1